MALEGPLANLIVATLDKQYLPKGEFEEKELYQSYDKNHKEEPWDRNAFKSEYIWDYLLNTLIRNEMAKAQRV